MSWGQTPRGGNPKNSGQFSHSWGAVRSRRLKSIKGYEAKATKLKLQAKGRDQNKYRFYELSMKAKHEKLGPALQGELARKEVDTYTPTQRVLLGTGMASTVGMIGAMQMIRLGGVRAQAAGLTGIGAMGAMAMGSSLAAGNIALRRRNEALEISGFKFDGALSNEELDAINGTAGTIATLGMGGALFMADRKLGGQLSTIMIQKVGKVAGKHVIAKNVRPAEVNNVARWGRMGKLPEDRVVFESSRPIHYKDIESAEIALVDAVQAAGGNHYRAMFAYYGSPRVNPMLRKLMTDAAEVLDIQNTTWAHAKINPLRAVGQAFAGPIPDFRLEIGMQYRGVQDFLAKFGVKHVDLVRGLGLSARDAKTYGLSVITEMPKPGESPWVEMTALMPPLNSFATSPKMALDYAFGRVVPVQGDIIVLQRTRLPRSRVYSFSGFGTGHDAEVIVTGGEMPVQMMAVSRKFIAREKARLGLASEDDVIGRLWDIAIVSKRAGQRKYRGGMTLVSKKSGDLAHKKRVQAALSLGGAGLGLSALATKGGAVATRQALKRAPAAAARYRLTPKVAENLDKTSLGLVTTASGVGGASGIHFAALQQAEAKKEDRVSKSAFGVIHKKSTWSEADRERHHRMANKIKPLVAGTPDPDDWKDAPRTPAGFRAQDKPRRPALTLAPRKPGGHDPEKRRQARMGIEEGAAATGAVATGGLTAGYARNAVMNSRGAKASAKRTVKLQRKSANKEMAAWALNANKDKPAAASAAKGALSYHKAAERSKFVTSALKAGAKSRTKQAVAAGAATTGLAAAAGGVHHLRTRGQGRQYSDWWDG